MDIKQTGGAWPGSTGSPRVRATASLARCRRAWPDAGGRGPMPAGGARCRRPWPDAAGDGRVARGGSGPRRADARVARCRRRWSPH